MGTRSGLTLPITQLCFGVHEFICTCFYNSASDLNSYAIVFTLICKQIMPHFLIKPDYNLALGYEAHLNLKEMQNKTYSLPLPHLKNRHCVGS